MTTRIDLLDHGYIELVDRMGTDTSIVCAARVSFNKRVDTMADKDIRLLRYLAKHGHWSPFTHATLSFRLKAPISVHRQYEKHHVGVNNNSESTRYVKVEPEFYFPKELRRQSADKKQGSDGILSPEETKPLRLAMDIQFQYAFVLYYELLRNGVANEVARDVLPLATYTTWISTMSLYAAFNIYKQRTHDGAQWEISQYAYALEKLVEPLFPHSWAALKEHTQHG